MTTWPLFCAIFLPGLAVNISKNEGSLLRRERPEGTSVIFQSELRRCSYAKAEAALRAEDSEASPRRVQVQRALREVKQVLAEHNVPVILVGGLAVGYFHSCAADLGDMSSDVATFGPWLEEAGLSQLSSAFQQRGHSLDLSACQAGPLRAGCQLKATLSGGEASLNIHALFTAGAAGAHFETCADLCGEECAGCNWAYARQSPQGLCPVPLGSLVLGAWMNETFWMPADMPSYQAAEYGAEAKGSCQAGALGFEYSGALPKAAEVMRQQRELAQKQRASIAAAAAYDRRLWHKYLAKNGVSWGYAGKPDSAPVSPFEPHLGAGLGLRRALLLCAALLAAAALYVCGRRLTACSRQSAYAALLQPSEGAVLALYLALLLAQSLSQHLAAASGHLALLAALALQLAQLVWAAAVVHHTLGLSSVWSLETRQPLATLGLTFLLGFCSAVSQWLSFVSLFWLDPATYLVILQVSLRLVEVAACSRQRFSSRHWLALGVFVTAVLLKGLKAASEQDMALYRGLLALLAQVLLSSLAVLCQPLLAEAPQLEVLQLGQKLQGLLVLLAIFVGLSYPRPWGTATEGIAEVVESEWIMTSMAFLLVSSILKSELPGSPVEELGVGSLLVKVSTLQWFLLGWGGGDASDVGVLFLGLLALAVCLVERLATLPVEEPKPTPKPRAALKPPLPKPSSTSKPTPVAKSAAAKRALVKPPQPKMMGRKSSRASEISTAPSLPSTPRSVPSCPPRRTDEDSSSSELSTDWSSESE